MPIHDLLRPAAILRALLGVTFLSTGAAHELRAQVSKADSLNGGWTRIDSSYDPNDRMRINIAGTTATLTFMPPSGIASFKVGNALWLDIKSNGTMRVLGSDGQYYPSTYTIDANGRLQVRVQNSGAGSVQEWRRTGPSLDGEWVRIAPGNPLDGTRVRVSGDEGSVRYLPATAARNLRIGSALWQSIRSPNLLNVLGGNSQYSSATFTREGQDRLWLSLPAGGRELWVRPEIVAAVRAASAGGAGNATTPNNQQLACAGSSLFHHKLGMDTEWRLTWGQPAFARTLGLGNYLGTPSAAQYVATTVQRSRFVVLPGAQHPDILSAIATIWQRKPDPGMHWAATNDLTETEFRQRSASFRANGMRPLSIEAYAWPDGKIRYSSAWVSNLEDIDWLAEPSLTSTEYGRIFAARRDSGFRIIDVEGYSTPQGVRYAGIWLRSCDNTNWRQFRDMTAQSYRQRLDSLGNLGFSLIDFEAYRTPNGDRIAGIWEKIPGRVAWQVRSGRTLGQFLNHHREYSDLGFRMVDFESYNTSNGMRYAGIWAENHPRARYALRPLVDDTVEKYRKHHAIPGMSVAIVWRGEVVYARGFGLADVARGREAHSGTIYAMASVSKAIAGSLAARLEADGRVDLKKLTKDYIPGLPSRHHGHTLENLLTKTGCIRHYGQTDPAPPARTYSRQLNAVKEIWSQGPLPNCTPGSTYHYSTHGYTYLGAALEEATGTSVADLIQQEIAAPLALRTLGPAHAEEYPDPDYHLAQPYTWNTAFSRSERMKFSNTTWKFFGGGMQASAVDLARFGWEHLTGHVVSDDVLNNRLWAPIARNLPVWTSNPAGTTARGPIVGLGWNVSADSTRAAHGGVCCGFNSELAVYRTDEFAIAILTNQRVSGAWTEIGKDHPLESLRAGIAGILRRNPIPAPVP